MKNEITLYFVEDNASFDTKTLSRCLTYLSEDEVLKYKAFHFEKDKRLYVISHAMKRMILSEITGISPEDLIFDYNEFGKPSLKCFVGVSFNLSHSKSVAVLAVSHNGQFEIGVDVECSQSYYSALDSIDDYFSRSECKLFLNKSKLEQNHLFFKLWTLKEAYMKALGKGLSLGLKNFSFDISTDRFDIIHYSYEENKIKWFFGQMLPFKNFHAAVAIRCCEANTGQFQIISFDWHPSFKHKDKNLEIISFTKFNSGLND